MYLNEATLLHNVKLRYMKNGIYVRIFARIFVFNKLTIIIQRSVFENHQKKWR